MSQLDLFAGPPPAQRHRPTSRAAAASTEARSPSLRSVVLELLRSEGPLTDEAMQQRLAMNPSTQRPRRIELVRLGLVEEAGEGTTSSGRRAVLWAAR